MINSRNIGWLTLIILAFTFLNSCKTRKDLLYLQDISHLEELNVPGRSPGYKIKPDDNLYINVITPDQNVSKLFNPTQGSGVYGPAQNFNSLAGIYISGFTVNNAGEVVLPIMGSINIMGMTALEAQAIIQEKTDLFLKDASVQVKVLSFKVTLLGEFRNPGVFYSYNNNLTILEAIGMAGGVTENAQLSQLLVVRKTPTGSKSFRLDLSQKNLLSSEAYFLQPNDVIYVNADKLKNIRLTTPTYSFVLSAITSFLVILQYIRLQ